MLWSRNKDTNSDEEVDEKEDIEGQVHLLPRTIRPGGAGLHCLPGNKTIP